MSDPDRGPTVDLRKPFAVTCCSALLLALIGVLTLAGGPLAARADDGSVFQQPARHHRLAQLRQLIAVLFLEQNYQLAETYGREAVDLIPTDPISHYNLACAEARLGKADQAVSSLQAALKYGFRGRELMQQDDDLSSLHDRPEWPDLLAAAGAAAAQPETRQVTAAAIQNGVARVEEQNTLYHPGTGLLHVFFAGSGADAEPDSQSPAIASASDAVSQQLNQWQQEGTAAGLADVLYDNHDRDHSNLDYARFPQLIRVEYCDAAKAQQIDHGLQHTLRFNGIVLGNSSTALTGSYAWRSQPRLAMADAGITARLAAQYFGNHLYVYPEHQDYDPGRNGPGYGDVYPANTPYLLISQGSSGSDRVFLDAVANTLAAFRPEVRQQLASGGMLMSAVQMILRRCNRGIQSDDDYLSGSAHPVVFQGSQLDPLRMVELAHELTPETLPPLCLLKVVGEAEAEVGRHYFDTGPRQQRFTTPAAIARIGRDVRQSLRLVVSAEDSRDLNGEELTWHWVLLQGDPQRVQIQPQNAAGSVAELTIAHHERFPVSAGSAMETNRVDIGVFVSNGHYFSAPAFVSVYWPDNEIRDYDAAGRILSVRYQDPAHKGNYVDPLVVTPIEWQDKYHYSGDQLTGWTRTRGQTEDFTADGALVLTRDSNDRPLTAQTVRYVAVPRTGKPPLLTQRPGSEILHYEYASADDPVGSVVRRTPAP